MAYGNGLKNLGKSYDRIKGVDGDTKNSTFAITYKTAFPDRFVECFIAEQNMVGVAIGMDTRRRNVVFASAFAAFFTRAFDQIRMGAISQTEVNFVGSHAGISIGEGGSHTRVEHTKRMAVSWGGGACNGQLCSPTDKSNIPVLSFSIVPLLSFPLR